eukprot:6346646-Ditylum_brightwellii.AAC.1
MASIKAECVPDDIVKVLMSKILQLSVNAQLTIMLMSCVGSSCSEPTLLLFLNDKTVKNIKREGMVDEVGRPDMLPSFSEAVREGFLKKQGSNYMFTHDQAQCAAYLLIPAEERDFWHLQIGLSIRNNAPSNYESK